VLRVGVVESDLAAGSDLFDAAVEYLGRSEERKSRMLVMVIIPGEELLTPSSRMGERSEPLRIVGLVLQRLELRLGEGVVVADVRTAEAAHDADGSEELCEALRPHRGAAIGVHRERTAGDAVALDSLGEEVLGELGALPLGEQPANRHATEQVEDHIEAVEDPVQRTAQLGNIPGPDLVGGRRREGRFGMLHRTTLCASLCALTGRGEHPVHRADRREVDTTRQQRRVDLRRRLVHELVAVQHVEQRLPLDVIEPARARPARGHRGRLRGLRLPVQRGAADPERSACLHDRDVRVIERFDGVHQLSPSVARLMPRIADTFF